MARPRRAVRMESFTEQSVSSSDAAPPLLRRRAAVRVGLMNPANGSNGERCILPVASPDARGTITTLTVCQYGHNFDVCSAMSAR